MLDAAARSRLARRRSRWIVSGVSLMAMVAGLVLSIALLRRTRAAVEPSVRFDPQECVRLLDVSRVYVIRRNPRDTAELWLGTAEGARMLDSRSGAWTRLGLDHGLPSETVADIDFAGDTAWVATWKGIARFDRCRGRFVPYACADGNAGGHVLAIAWLPGHGAFFYVDGRGIYRVGRGDTVASRTVVGGLAPGARVTLLERADSLLLVGAEGGRVLLHDPARATTRECVFSRDRSPKTLVWDVLLHAGRVYVATSDDGVWTGSGLDDTLRPLTAFPAKGAYVFADDADGFWCGTPFGLWRYHDQGQTWIQFVHPEQTEPTAFQVFSLARSGPLLWYGSMDLGAGYLNTAQVEWVDLRAGLSSPNVAAIASNDTSLWVGFGYHAGYLDRLDPVTVQFERNYNSRDSIFESHIQSLAIIGGRLYYGGYRSFGYITLGETSKRRFFLSGDRERLPFADVAGIAAWDSASICLAGLFAVVQYWPDRDSFAVLESTATGRVTCVLPRGDTLWYGTLAGGVYAYDRRVGRSRSAGLRGMGRIVGIAALPGSPVEMFVATQKGGCHALNTVTRETRALEVPRGLLPGNTGPYERELFAMQVINGRIWLGTRAAGCMVFDPAGLRWTALGYQDGLVSNEILSLCESPRYVWIGSYGGLCRLSKQYLEQRYFGRAGQEAAGVRPGEKG